MEDIHLLNAISMLRRRAADAFLLDRQVYEAMGVKPTDFCPAIYWDMVDELKRRNVDLDKEFNPPRILEI